MRQILKTAAAVVVAVGAMTAAREASAAVAEANGAFFVHGTGDYSAPTSAASARTPSGGTAISDYWTGSSLGSMTAAPQGGSWSYGAAGYQGAATDAMTSWGVVADQIYDYYYSGNSGQIYNVVVVTHSNGSNPLRYLAAHPTAVTPKGRTGQSVLNVIKKVVMLAADNKGTPLADKVTSSGSAAGIGNSILSFFGGSSWNNAAVRQQIQANMTTYNGNSTFAVGGTIGGIATSAIHGVGTYAAVWSSDAYCGGYGQTAGLRAAALYGFGTSSGNDGFIGSASATYVGSVPYAGDDRLNHNQSRRSCHGVAPKIAAEIHGAMGGTFAAIPSDYSMSPGAQACNSTTQGWTGSTAASNYTYWYGCTSAMKSDLATDHDCVAAYGGDNGNLAVTNFAATAYGNTSYYANTGSTTGCSDSWLGDGECDLCLLAKYGYDAANGGTGPDDCVNKGAGTVNRCADIGYNGNTGVNQLQYLSYNASH